MHLDGDFLLDPEGHAWPASSHHLRDLYEAPEDGLDFAVHVVRNLGFARLRYKQSSVRVGFCPAALTSDTVSAVVHAMIEAARSRHILEDAGPTPCPVILADVEDAAACFVHLAAAPGVFARPRYHVQPLSLQRLNHARLSPLRQALLAWRAAGGRADAPGSVWLAKGRSLLARMGPGPALVAWIGRGYTAVDEHWLDAAVGRRLDAHPDPAYGAAVAASFQAAAERGEPILELVDAEIASPGANPVRYRYERLLLPWRAAGTSPKVAFVSSSAIVRTASSRAGAI